MRLVPFVLLAACSLGTTDPEQPLQFEDNAGSMTTRFTDDAVQVRSPEGLWHVDLQVMGFGRDTAWTEVTAVAPLELEPGKVVYPYPNLATWYKEGAEGVEQGFDIAQRPAGAGDLVVEMALDTNLIPALQGSEAVRFYDDAGKIQVNYDKLVVYDANGAELTSWMELDCSTTCALSLHVDDQDAVYPIVIDPFLWTLNSRFRHTPTTQGDGFGSSIAVLGDVAVVGADLHDNGGNNRGAAFVFERSGSTWTQVQQLSPLNLVDHTRFGHSVAFDGTRIVVGQPGDVAHTAWNGRATIFQLSGGAWVVAQDITSAPVAGARARFGAAVAIDGDAIAIGSASVRLVGATGQPQAHDLPAGGGVDAGAVWMFHLSGAAFVQAQKLSPPAGAAANDLYGAAVALDDDQLIVGAPGTGVSRNGAAYVYTQGSGGTWANEQALVAADSDIGDHFGFSVAIDGDLAVVGAPYDDESTTNAGAAYVFRNSGGSWSEEQKLLEPDTILISGPEGPNPDDNFGSAVAVNGDTVVVAAELWDRHTFDVEDGVEVRPDRGMVWSFDEKGGPWSVDTTFEHSGRDDRYGRSVSFQDDRLGIGAPFNDVAPGVSTATNEGAAYIHDGDNGDVDGDGFVSTGSPHFGDDCDDGDAAINPGATEVEGNNVDENCDTYLARCSTNVGIPSLCEGRVAITELMVRPGNGVDPGFGEWVEVINKSSHQIDLLNSRLFTDDGLTAAFGEFIITQNIVLDPGGLALFAGSSSALVNGGVVPDDAWNPLAFQLFDAPGSIVQFRRVDGGATDLVAYTGAFSSSGTVIPQGGSLSLDPVFHAPATSTSIANDTAVRWCDGLSSFGTGQFGTPGVANESCTYSFPYTYSYATPIVFGPSGVITVTFDFDDTIGERFFTTSNGGEGLATRTTSDALAGQQLQFQYEYVAPPGLGPIYTGFQTFGTDCVPDGVISGTVSPGGAVAGTFDVTNCP